MSADSKVYPAQDINPSTLAQFEEKQRALRERINRAFFVDLFRQMTASDEVQAGTRTATEVRLAQQESMRIMGPVLEILNDSVFTPMVANLFYIMREQGLLPEPPEELMAPAKKVKDQEDGSTREVQDSNLELKVEYISIMAQALKLEGLGAVERFLSVIGAVYTFDQSVIHKIKTGNLIDQVAKILSVPPDMVATDEEYAGIMADIQQKAAEAQQAEIQAQQATAVNKLANSPTGEPSALTTMMPSPNGRMGPAPQPAPMGAA
jgi:hypothetical protein